MVSTLSRNRVRENMPVAFTSGSSQQFGFARAGSAAAPRVTLVDSAALQNALGTYPVSFTASTGESLLNGSAVRNPKQTPARPHLVPVETPQRKLRKSSLLVRANRALQATLIALCGIAVLGYGYDVATTHDVSKTQDQVRRISEQNAEYSANLLKAVSYDDVQRNVNGHKALRPPEDVKIVPEVTAPKFKAVRPAKDHLPLMAGY